MTLYELLIAPPIPQRQNFGDDGYCVHRLPVAPYKGWFSIWFDAKGEPLDMEQRIRGNSMRPVYKNSPCWIKVSKKAKEFANKNPEPPRWMRKMGAEAGAIPAHK